MYSGTALIRSPVGQKSLAVLTGDRINEIIFFLRKIMVVLLGGRKNVAVITR